MAALLRKEIAVVGYENKNQQNHAITAKQTPISGEHSKILILMIARMTSDSFLSSKSKTEQEATSLHSAFPLFQWAGRVAGIISKLRKMVGFEVPVGYEDEAGFHYGVKTAPIAKRAGRTVLLSVVFGGIIASTPASALAACSVTLAWSASTCTNIAGYNIYYGQGGCYTNKISVGNVTSATISGLATGCCNYFEVTAYNTAGLESVPSNDVSYMFPTSSILAIQTVRQNGLPASISITASGTIPTQWALESSPDLKTWQIVTQGTNTAVNVSVNITGAPMMYFRLMAE